MRLDVALQWIILVAERRKIEPLAPPHFLADAALDVLGEIVGIILGLAERHLEHK